MTTSQSVWAGIGIGLLSGAIGAVGAIIGSKKYFKNTVEEQRDTLQKNIEESEKLLKDLPDQVDQAVRFVYDNEARTAFDKRLKSMNFEEIALNECQKNVKNMTDPVLRKYIRDTYYGQIKSVMEDEIKTYFKDGIKKYIDMDIDSAFITRTAKAYIKECVNEVVEDEVEHAVDKFDISDVVEEYIDDNSTKIDAVIKKTINKVFYDRFDESFVDKVVDAVEDAATDD